MANVKMISIAMAAALVGSVSVAQADSSTLFGAQDLSQGYMLVGEKGTEGKCGEGKCGGDKAKEEGKCGEGKCGEGKCGGDKAKEGADKAAEGKCGADKAKEGKCGGDKAKEKACGGTL